MSWLWHLQIPFVETFLEVNPSMEPMLHHFSAPRFVGEDYRLVSHKPGVFEPLGFLRSSDFLLINHKGTPRHPMPGDGIHGLRGYKSTQRQRKEYGHYTAEVQRLKSEETKHDLMAMCPATKSSLPQFPWL